MSSKDPEWPKWCSICDVKLFSPAIEASHYGGKKHKSRLGTPTEKQRSSTQCDNNTSGTADHPNAAGCQQDLKANCLSYKIVSASLINSD